MSQPLAWASVLSAGVQTNANSNCTCIGHKDGSYSVCNQRAEPKPATEPKVRFETGPGLDLKELLKHNNSSIKQTYANHNKATSQKYHVTCTISDCYPAKNCLAELKKNIFKVTTQKHDVTCTICDWYPAKNCSAEIFKAVFSVKLDPE